LAAIAIETPAAAEPVSIDEMKSHLRVTSSEDDDLIGTYIEAARISVEGFTSRSLVQKGYRQSLDNFPYYVDPVGSPQAYPPSLYSLPRYASSMWNYSQMIKLLRSPLVKVSKITYVGTDSQLHDLLPSLQFDAWSANAEFEEGNQILDSNGNIQQVSQAGESGSSVPTWASTTGATTNDGGVVWVCKGAPASQDFFVDRDSEPPRIFPSLTRNTWPPALYVPNAVRIHYIAGYSEGDGTDVPANFRLAIMILVAGYYEFREPVSALGLKEVPQGIQRLLWNDRVLDLAPTRG
jgi:hypothetical protein